MFVNQEISNQPHNRSRFRCGHVLEQLHVNAVFTIAMQSAFRLTVEFSFVIRIIFAYLLASPSAHDAPIYPSASSGLPLIHQRNCQDLAVVVGSARGQRKEWAMEFERAAAAHGGLEQAAFVQALVRAASDKAADVSI